MKIAGALLGLLGLAAVFVVWFRIYKSIKGDEFPLNAISSRKPRGENNSLEQFIASYKRGEVAMDSSAPAAQEVTPPPSSTPIAPAQSAPARRDAFVSGSTKLAYLVCKAGLRDHHVFAHVQISALSTGGAVDPALAHANVDLLICNAAMSAVAAIDVIDAGPIDAGNAPAHAAKADYLKALDIRYLQLTAKSLPRPDEMHALLYKM